MKPFKVSYNGVTLTKEIAGETITEQVLYNNDGTIEGSQARLLDKVLARFEELLKSHDWNYHYANGSAYSEGSEEKRVILEWLNDLGGLGDELYNKYDR